MDLHEAQAYLQASLHEISHAFQKVPGSAVLIRYIQSSYQNDPVRSAIELILVIFFVRYLLAPSYPTHHPGYVKLREDEIDELVREWEPEPLVAPQSQVEEMEAEKIPVIIGPTGPKVKLSTGKTVTNLASYNFYNFNASESIKEKAIQTLRTYGVGPCGPPQFYGTQDVHMRTEEDIAGFLGVQASIVYSHAFSTITSMLPSFCKRGDVIVADEMVNYQIRKGIQASRSTIRWYKHNDMADLEKILKKVAEDQAKKKILTRRFIVTEGLFEMIGDVSDLPKLIELKEKYKFRLALDETFSFGVLGRNGRGLTEAQNVDAEAVDMIVGSLAGPLCAAGGFCAGTKEAVQHQRINAAAYTYSAALPAMSAVTASETLNVLHCNPDILIQCRENIKAMRAQLDPRSDWVECTSDPENPVMLLVFKADVVDSRRLTIEDEERLLAECVDETLANGVLITRLKSQPLIKDQGAQKGGVIMVQPALKVCITSALSKKEIEKAGVTIRHAITKVMTRKSSRPTSLAA
ncbi:pyridoxal phosphate-dependent transferase [Xylariomycetidae sp. FL2044]|nr:pyridoxal phosphate-dependent transferase [Xylariomycetidae sp. FL2044]